MTPSVAAGGRGLSFLGRERQTQPIRCGNQVVLSRASDAAPPLPPAPLPLPVFLSQTEKSARRPRKYPVGGSAVMLSLDPDRPLQGGLYRPPTGCEETDPGGGSWQTPSGPRPGSRTSSLPSGGARPSPPQCLHPRVLMRAPKSAQTLPGLGTGLPDGWSLPKGAGALPLAISGVRLGPFPQAGGRHPHGQG